MDNKELLNVLKDCELVGEKIVVKTDFAKVVGIVKNDFGFDFLKEIVGIDHKDNGIELVYRLYSSEDKETVWLSTTTKNSSVESISKLFDSAVAEEKEIYDMFGVKFIGNDELKRLYMPEGWKGNPLKKDYKSDDERLSWND